MFIINLYRYLFGYVNLKISGNFPERILNLCAQNKIVVWDIFRSRDSVKISVMVRDFKKFHKIRGKSGVKVKILKKKGLPFKIQRYKLRIGVVAGFAFFFILLKFLSLFVWDIEIIGNKTTPDEEIIKECSKLGIYNGRYIEAIDSKLLKDKLLLNSDKLAWASINIEGCVVTVNVTETLSGTPEFSPSNIVSSSDAVIKQIKVTSGQVEVYTGQAVSRGDILISGTVAVADKVNFTRASGEILGEVQETFTFTKNYNQKLKQYNGKTSEKTVLEFFGIKLPLYLGSTHGDFSADYSNNQIEILGKKIPITLYKMDCKHYDTIIKKFNRDELITQIETEFNDYTTKKGLQEIDITAREIIEENEGITVKYTVKHIKNLCVEENLLFSTLN